MIQYDIIIYIYTIIYIYIDIFVCVYVYLYIHICVCVGNYVPTQKRELKSERGREGGREQRNNHSDLGLAMAAGCLFGVH